MTLIAAPTLFEPIVVSPASTSYELLLTATTAISHHDPAVQDDSNRSLFNRQKQLVHGPAATALPDQAAVDALLAAHPLPADIAPILQDASFGEFIAAALLRVFADQYNARDGTGLFSGMERWTRLEDRVRHAAVGAAGLRAWWDRLTRLMQVPIHPGDGDLELLKLLTVPAGLQQVTLRALTDDYRSIVSLARLWHDTAKRQSAAYAEKAGTALFSQEMATLAYDAATLTPGSSAVRVLEVPHVSANSLRHQVVREPAWLHLTHTLGLKEELPGLGPVPAGAEAIFYNGGNIRSGAKQPSNVFGLAVKIRAAFPSLDLVGGVTDSFDLGESRLNVAAWLVCAENRPALVGSPAYDLPAASISAFDLLDDVTMTRQAGVTGLGQMIFSLESLCAGAQFVCRLNLAPGTPELTRGALVAAVETFLGNGPTVAGQAARGFGFVTGEWLKAPGEDAPLARARYEAYLNENRAMLTAALRDGTVGSGAAVLS